MLALNDSVKLSLDALRSHKLRAALTLIRDGISPTRAAAHVGLGRSTLYRELAHTLGALP